ncbi:lanC-like protein GCL2 [Dioscorea cayenensis subsp. rotundata]|uniref:LanC-like protein GCL2 n=1 Tax=Dioscorea cayennensis subsp. rotundata TaxID=55577 RepID=A0AB40CDT6_DIOCR|nr:lanC-like protein GCL2 [Dioscorea cayenensis subsp. rotundata]
MADRFFPNDMPNSVPETDDPSAAGAVGSSSSLLKLLSLPYSKTAERFLRAGLDLKEKVVKETWVRAGRRVKDFSLYTGALGTAFLLLKSYQVTGDRRDLTLCNEIVRGCDSASQGSKYVTFICGRAGVCALGAVVAKHTGDEALLNHYLKAFQEINLPPGVPNELLYGRAGYLWACSFLNKHVGDGTIPSTHMIEIAKEIITDGRKLSNKGSCPLMYEWHGTKYWGAAHGLAGIMHVLMDMDLKPEECEFVKGTLAYMIQNCFRSGNYPSSEGKDTDRLVHWCHGAPGLALTFNKAALVFKDEQFLRAATDAAEVVWNRGLLKRVGVCHGVSGNAHVFLSLYRSTGNVEYLYRAKAFTCFLLDKANQLIAEGKMHSGDRPYSLFEGQAGMAYLFLNMVKPSESLFPAYEL